MTPDLFGDILVGRELQLACTYLYRLLLDLSSGGLLWQSKSNFMLYSAVKLVSVEGLLLVSLRNISM